MNMQETDNRKTILIELDAAYLDALRTAGKTPTFVDNPGEERGATLRIGAPAQG